MPPPEPSLPPSGAPEKPRVLVVVDVDPRVSPRPAEAVRVAAGLAAWGQIEVTLALVGESVRVAADHPSDLRDGHICAEHFPGLLRSGGGVMLLQIPTTIQGVALRTHPAVRVVGAADFADQIAVHSHVLAL